MSKSKKVKTNTVCKRCNKVKHLQPNNGICRDCDTSHMGTWYLSCISELGHIELSDTIIGGCADGVTGNDFLGVPNKTPIFCCVDKVDKNLFHAFCDQRNIDFRVNFSIDIVQ